jgi:putative endonuclease
MARKQMIGKWGERMAEEYLTSAGLLFIERNVRTPYGEIDLVMQTEGDVLVFIEVKTRKTQSFGKPEESITAKKKTHMLQSAEAYLLQHPEIHGDWRVDVIAIYQPGSSDPEITWFENALA